MRVPDFSVLQKKINHASLGPQADNRITLGQIYAVLTPDGQDHGMNGIGVLDDTLGIGKDGGFAEYVIPDDISPEAAAVASDAGVTTFNAVKHTAGATGSKVLIFVYVCNFKPEARKLALDLGANGAFNLIELSNQAPAAGFTVDAPLIGFVTNTFNLAMAALNGNDVKFPGPQVGVSAENLVFITGNTVVSGVQKVLDLFAKETIRPHITSEALENVGQVINQLRSFRITGRRVVMPRST
ncbi:hypothetical protein DFH07DRAFT_959761 [Mycena maculata]|uniref:Uncharacterized protein n=1 Tax=Mycena maculata TaxID=230809 RepID=A0AAD7J228_9AGAR|nr:hypothetical protein DFH07DRAFT_959761 [Mycena maculata]